MWFISERTQVLRLIETVLFCPVYMWFSGLVVLLSYLVLCPVLFYVLSSVLSSVLTSVLSSILSSVLFSAMSSTL